MVAIHEDAVVISTFTGTTLANLLAKSEIPTFSVRELSFATLMATPFDSSESTKFSHALFSEADVSILWTQPETVLNSFTKLVAGETIEPSSLDRDIAQFVEVIERLAETVATVFVPLWSYPSSARQGLIEFREGQGIFWALTHANAELIRHTSKLRNVFVLNVERWLSSKNGGGFSSKLWYMAKIPFQTEVFERAAQDIISAVRSQRGLTKKLIIVDLDDTLWGGIVGDEGWQNVKLGGHDPIGEAFVDFQRALLSLSKRGIALAIVSKNEQDVALNAIRSHPEMVLRDGDFAAWRINWNDKAQNIIEITRELNVGTDSVVFLDDNPSERARVRETLPQVTVPDLPANKLLYREFLVALPFFDTVKITTEDRERTQMYVTERQREELKSSLASPEEWLRSLSLHVIAEEVSASNLPRVVQLLNKTNQFNLSTRRCNEDEFLNWLSEPGHAAWGFRVSDRFGDYGLTGIMSIEVGEKDATLRDAILSCRVFGRQIEEAMFGFIVQHAMEKRCSNVLLTYIPTAKNAPTLDFITRAAIRPGDREHEYVWNVNEPFAIPNFIEFQISKAQKS